MRLRSRIVPLALTLVSCATSDAPPAATPVTATAVAAETQTAEKQAVATAVELPFDPSPDDKAALGATGFLGVAAVPPETGYAKGPKLAGVKLGAGLEKAGLAAGDVIVKFAGVTFAAKDDDSIGTLRKRLLELPFDSDVQIAYWREKQGVREVTARLGRQPPSFASLDTPADWLAGGFGDPETTKLIADVVALDHGEARFADVVARNRACLVKTDALRLRETTIAHLDLAANEPLARALTDAVARKPAAAARVAAGAGAKAYVDDGKLFAGLDPKTLDGVADAAARLVVDVDAKARAALAAWSPEDREFMKTEFHRLTDRMNEGEYLYDDPDVARERANRRIVKLLAAVDRAQIALAAEEATGSLAGLLPKIASACDADGREGLLVARDTPAGRVEIWGRGNTRHVDRCAFCFDFAGDDDWLDCAGRADLDQPVCITVDWSGNDVYGGTSDFNEGGAFGGIGILIDRMGDDQYVARRWSQGCGVAGFGLLVDHSGRDVYHGQEECQGVGLAGAGVLVDDEGDDLYTGQRFCQGVGLAGGVGALVDRAGDDRYVCTGRYESEYGEPGLFSGWGQGVGFGFRGVASGGIGILYDLSGRDVYEAGNFSQGGGYFYAWGILRDDKGDDRYVGSRYAQGFAAHQAVGTFLEGGGNDVYQSHSNVACGLAWDESSVVFHDMGGDDVYEQGGFSLASAAHNSMVLFLDDGGDDRYPERPAHAGSNEYHGGRSFALFVHRGGRDVYGRDDAKTWNDRVFWCDDGAYFVDVPRDAKPLAEYVR
jgi:hypothetical protein